MKKRAVKNAMWERGYVIELENLGDVTTLLLLNEYHLTVVTYTNWIVP